MNEVLKTIAERYSCRAFTGEVPDDAKLSAIAEAAVASPSGRNRQAWRVIVVKNRELIAEIEAEAMANLAAMEDKTMYQRIIQRGGTVLYHAQCLIMLPIDPTELVGASLDCGIVCQTIALAATSLGMDNLICGLAGLAFAGEKTADLKARLGFPEGFEFGSSVLLGYAEKSGAPHQPDMSKISFVE